MKVIFFTRKTGQSNYSIEIVFRQIRSSLDGLVDCYEKQFSYISKGFFNRLCIGIEAMFSQGDVNHITGDVHFVALFLRKNRTVLTIHDIGVIQRLHPLSRWIFKWFWIVLPIKRSAIVTTISQATRQELLKYARADANKIKVIYNPMPLGFSKALKPFNKLKPVILQIGTKENKNISRVIKALKGIPCLFEIVGFVYEKIKSELINSGVEFKIYSNLTDEEMRERYKNSDVVILTSTYEGFGLPILEANATGRVVVTSNISSMPEVANNAAILVNPYDVSSIRAGILKVINDDVHRDKLITNGFENCKRFDVSIIAKQYLDIYTEVYDHLINR